MAFVRSPDGISIEILQDGEPLPEQEPWISMENSGSWWLGTIFILIIFEFPHLLVDLVYYNLNAY